MLASQSYKILPILMGKVKHYFIIFITTGNIVKMMKNIHIVHTYKVLVKSQDKRNKGVY